MKNVISLLSASLTLILFFGACSGDNGTKKKAANTPETNIVTGILATSSISPNQDALIIELALSENHKGAEIMYFLNGEKENAFEYENPLYLKEGIPGMAMVYFEGNPVPGSEVYFYNNRATGKQVEILTQIWPRKKGQLNKENLTDGLFASPEMEDENWVVFYGVPAGIKIDLGEIIPIEEICIRFLQDINNRIFLPIEIHYSISSDDEEWIAHKSYLNRESQEGSPVGIKDFSVPGHQQKARYIKIEAKQPGPCPDWHPEKDQATIMYCDEVVVE
ncbi:MAG: hypothetical protein K9H64_18725 [Bacteroidales bacterium]|nr:hypothetical protein [Bacteroidales bacterium]MCF8458091.1 hypothetical protein [Bacteroidales bacterium]